MKQFEFWKVCLSLAAACLVLYLVFYTFKTKIASSLFPNEIVVTTQGDFVKKDVRIDMVGETGQDTVIVFANGEPQESFKSAGLTRFLVYERGELVAEFEHFKDNLNIGNTYHFYLSANADSVFMDMRVEGVGSGR